MEISDGVGDDRDLQILSSEELREQLKEHASMLANTMEAIPDMLFRVDENGIITGANRAVLDILEYDKDDVIETPVDNLFAEDSGVSFASGGTIDPWDFIERLYYEGTVTNVEAQFVNANGDKIPVSLSASTIDSGGSGTGGLVIVAKDITDRKEVEERAEFLHSLLRHDLGNKLQMVRGYANLIEDSELDDEDTKRLKRVCDGVTESIELIQNVRTLNKLDGGVYTNEIALNNVIEESIERHQDLADEVDMNIWNWINAHYVVDAGPLLKELFANLIENSLKHSGGSQLRISAEKRGQDIVVTLSDDGRGVPDGEKSDIFKRGYSNEKSGGSGLGMYLASEIASQYGGGIEVMDSEEGGARFDVTLRLAET